MRSVLYKDDASGLEISSSNHVHALSAKWPAAAFDDLLARFRDGGATVRGHDPDIEAVLDEPMVKYFITRNAAETYAGIRVVPVLNAKRDFASLAYQWYAMSAQSYRPERCFREAFPAERISSSPR